MKNKKSILIDKCDYLYIVLMDIVIVTIFAVSCRIFPFGKYTSLMWDADGQYVNFMSYLQSLLQGKSYEAMYSLNVGMGNGTIALLAYYLLSPYNLIIVFFSRQQLPIAIWIIQILKLTSGSVTMLFYSKKHSNNKYLNIIFALAYAFSGYSIAMLQNFMFLDAVILLPLLIYCIETIERNYGKLFLISWLLIISNFYIGYSTCIFIGIYYFYHRVLVNESKMVNVRNEIHIFMKFLCALLTSVGASSVILVPVIYELSKNRLQDIGNNNITVKDFLFFALTIVLFFVALLIKKTIGVSESRNKKIILARTFGVLAFTAIIWKLFGYLEYLGVFKRRNFALPLKFIIGSYNTSELVHGLPNIYITVLALIFIIMFASSINAKTRLINISFIVLIYLLMSFRISNYVWSGFTEPSGSPYRYSFCFIFVLLKIAIDYTNSGRITCPKYLSMIILVGLAVVAAHLYKQNGMDFITKTNLALTILYAVIYIVVLLSVRLSGQAKYGICMVLVCTELSINAVISLKAFVNSDYNTYLDYCKISQQEKSIICSEVVDNEVYRFESNLLGKSVWPYVANNNSIVHYSSVMPGATVAFLDNYGMAAGEYMRNLATTLRVDADPRLLAFLGIRYLVVSDKLGEGYSELDYNGEIGYYLYRNDYNTSMILLANDDINEQGALDEQTIIELIDNKAITFADSKLLQTSFDQYDAFIANDDNESVSVTLMLPYEEGLHIFVDGEEVEKYKAFGFYLGFDLDSGVHEIVIKYKQPFWISGIVISIIFAMAFLIWNKIYIVKNKAGMTR